MGKKMQASSAMMEIPLTMTHVQITVVFLFVAMDCSSKSRSNAMMEMRTIMIIV